MCWTCTCTCALPFAKDHFGCVRISAIWNWYCLQMSASARGTAVVTKGVKKTSGLPSVNEVYQWGHGNHVPSRVAFNSAQTSASHSRWQTHDARVNIVAVAAAKHHNVALSSVGQVFTWGFGADNLGETRIRANTPRVCCGFLRTP